MHKVSSRRELLRNAAALLGAAALSTPVFAKKPKPMIQTVSGRVSAADFGFALPHEHVMCDFIGADKTSRARWNVEEVVAAMLPRLQQIKARGVRGFVDCTPAYLGRDPRVLRVLAQKTGLHILTNTGYYGGANDKYLPPHAFSESAEQLVARWIGEWKNGLEDSGVKPGFVKIGVDEIAEGESELSPVDAKLVRAAARTSRESGLAVTCHTQGPRGALAATRLFIAEKGAASRFIVAHSDGHGHETNRKIAELGAWVSFDGIGYRPLEEHLKMVRSMLDSHTANVLLSQDRGWFWVGEPQGGKILDFNYLPDTFLPALGKSGVSQKTIPQLTVANPARFCDIED